MFEVGGLVDIISPFWVDWFTAILFGALLITELAFLPETLYPRKYMLSKRVPSSTCNECSTTEQVEPKRTTNLSFVNFQPLPGMRHPKPWDSVLRFFLTFRYPVVVLSTGIFCFAWYWWVLSVVTFIPAAYAQYSPSIQGLMFVGFLLGSWFAELFCSGRLSDWIVQRQSKKNGVSEIDLSQLTDGLRAEREQGITIDVAYKYFSTPKRKFIIADAPGHIQYTRNMVTGASNSDLAIILVDARNGVAEQTRRHSIIASLLNIPHIVVAINKMDLVEYSQDVYNNIVIDYAGVAQSLGLKDITYIPISALNGDNLVPRTLSALGRAGAHILALAQSTSSHHISFMLPEAEVDTVVRTLHADLGLA